MEYSCGKWINHPRGRSDCVIFKENFKFTRFRDLKTNVRKRPSDTWQPVVCTRHALRKMSKPLMSGQVPTRKSETLPNQNPLSLIAMGSLQPPLHSTHRGKLDLVSHTLRNAFADNSDEGKTIANVQLKCELTKESEEKFRVRDEDWWETGIAKEFFKSIYVNACMLKDRWCT